MNSLQDYETDPWPWGGEPIYNNGEFVGTITTCSFGFSLQKHVGLGYVTNPDSENEGVFDNTTPKQIKLGNYQIEIAGRRFEMKVRLTPPKLPNLGDSSAAEAPIIYKATRHE